MARSLALVKRLAIMLAALVLGLGVPTLATAQLGPTNVPAPLTQTDESDEAAPVEDDGGLSTLQLVLIFGAAIGVVAGIGCVIMRDARHAAPAAARAARAADPRAGRRRQGQERSPRASASARRPASATRRRPRATSASATARAELDAGPATVPRAGALTFGESGYAEGESRLRGGLKWQPR